MVSLYAGLGGLEAGYQLVKEPVCAAMPAEFECDENLPWFWKELTNLLSTHSTNLLSNFISNF